MVIIPETMTLNEAEQALHMSRKSVLRLCDRGLLRYARPAGTRRILIYAEDVQRLLAPINR